MSCGDQQALWGGVVLHFILWVGRVAGFDCVELSGAVFQVRQARWGAQPGVLRPAALRPEAVTGPSANPVLNRRAPLSPPQHTCTVHMERNSFSASCHCPPRSSALIRLQDKRPEGAGPGAISRSLADADSEWQSY